ncbi:hypothetical protein [Streptomyces sp. NPDC059166]|uniref:hypothetical protein n=1 Tax=Streptomyces sp. NPDC059166 TaxID=3346752 RepID=UPI00367E0932
MGIRGAVADEKRESGAVPSGDGGPGPAARDQVAAPDGDAVADVDPDHAALVSARDNPSATPSDGPVFVDATGRRGRTWRRAGTIAALCCACYAATLAATLAGGDSTAPFLRLPRAMGLDRDAAPGATAADGRTPRPAPTEQAGAAEEELPPAAAPAVTPEPRRGSGDPGAIPVIDPPQSGQAVVAPARGPSEEAGRTGDVSAPEPAAQAGGAGGDRGAEDPSAGAGPDADTPAPAGGGAQEPSDEGTDGEGTDGERGPLGELVGGLLDGLLGVR